MSKTLIERAERLNNTEKKFMLKTLGESLTYLNAAKAELLAQVARLDGTIEEQQRLSDQLVQALTKQTQ